MDRTHDHPVALASDLADALEEAARRLQEHAYASAEDVLATARELALRLRDVEVGRWLREQETAERRHPVRSRPRRAS
ncbi:MAG: hypothetical protein ACOZNI_29665 [Myxococcota bacterium]